MSLSLSRNLYFDRPYTIQGNIRREGNAKILERNQKLAVFVKEAFFVIFALYGITLLTDRK